MRRDLKKIRSSRFKDFLKLKVQILNEVALLLVVRKRVRSQESGNENTLKFPSIEV